MSDEAAADAGGKGPEPLLSMCGGTVRFGNIVALDGVDFQVMPGEIVGLLGSNGAGKSTLVKALIGFYRLDGGQIRLQGEAMELWSPQEARQRGIETVFQDLSLADDLSVSRNFFIGKEILRRVGPLRFPDARRMRRIAMDCLGELGFAGKVDRNLPVGALSGGERQLIAIARAAHFVTKLLILDEPFSALAETSMQSVRSLIKKAKGRGVSVVLVTHHAPEVFEMADRFVVLQSGRNFAELRKEDTDMRDLEKLLISQRLAAVKEMAAGVAHQVKNPLGVMRVSVEMLRRKFRVERFQDEYRQVLDVLASEIDSLDHIVVSFMDFAHQTRVDKRSCPVAALVRRSVEGIPAASSGGVQISLSLPDPAVAHSLDPDLMKQAISNLVVNAVEASPANGAVEVRASLRDGRLVVEVRDWGCGMDPETLRRIYNPFFSTKSAGTGLGLSIAHRVVELHGGRIEVDTAPAAGTTFRLIV